MVTLAIYENIVYTIVVRREGNTINRKFIEARTFQNDWKDLGLGDNELKELEEILMENPEAGNIIQHTGGARKIRIAFPHRGKSGSGRVIYVDAVIKETIYLVAVFAKNVKENLSDAERNILRDMVKRLKEE